MTKSKTTSSCVTVFTGLESKLWPCIYNDDTVKVGIDKMIHDLITCSVSLQVFTTASLIKDSASISDGKL